MPRTAVRANVRKSEVDDQAMSDRLRGGGVSCEEGDDQLSAAVSIWNAMKMLFAVAVGVWIGEVLYQWVVS